MLNKSYCRNNPFALGTPSVFVVWSPFQILCAVSAIRQLEIDDYLIIVYLPKGSPRNQQIINTLDLFKMKYKVLIEFNRYRSYLCLFRAFFPKNTKYSRLFIGDYRDYNEHLVGLGSIVNGADIVYLDDGNPSIRLFKGKFDYKSNKILNVLSRYRRFDLFHNMLSIYMGIPNDVFNIKRLSFENIIENDLLVKSNLNAVVIVGTYIDSYCEGLSLSQELFIEKLDRICEEIASFYKEQIIYYFPHGSETQDYDRIICEKYNIHYHRCLRLIELELQELCIYPLAVYGFTSNALFTIKKLYPNCKVVNILFDNRISNSKTEEYLEISNYYSENNIECKTLSVI